MSFLAPMLLVGLSALALPVLIHLVQRERRRVVPFPSLMFLRRIPYQSVRRRKIRDWLLLAVRLAALLLIVLAFARPFFLKGALASASATGGREVVVLLDRSASMAYGDHWTRAQAAARDIVTRLGSADQATLVLFDATAEETVRATGDRARLAEAIAAAHPGAGATRYAPALKLASSILAKSSRPRREAALISDLQKSGWRGGEDVHLPGGAALTIVPVTSTDVRNVSVPTVSTTRALFAGRERVTLTAAVRNAGASDAVGVPVSLQVGNDVVQTIPTTIGANASAAVAFTPFTLGQPGLTATVRAGSDAMPGDNVFRLVLAPSPSLGVLLVEPEGKDPLYLRNALSIGTTPAFRIDIAAAAMVRPADFARHALVVLDGVPASRVGATALTGYVEQGGGLLMLLGGDAAAPVEHASTGVPDVLPAALPDSGAETTPTTIGYVDYSHPIFEIFQGAHGGDFSGAHVYRYRTLAVGRGDRVLARFSDSGVAALERSVGKGRVIAWSSTLDDSWNDLALEPVFLPFVQRVARYLARYQPQPSWRTVGDAVDLVDLDGNAAAAGRASGAASTRTPLVLTPSGRRIADEGRRFVELDEQGVYEIRAQAGPPVRVAANLDPAESDLTAWDPTELRAAITGRARPATPSGPAALLPEELERRQSIWWYLLAAGLLLLVADTLLASGRALADRAPRDSRTLRPGDLVADGVSGGTPLPTPFSEGRADVAR